MQRVLGYYSGLIFILLGVGCTAQEPVPTEALTEIPTETAPPADTSTPVPTATPEIDTPTPEPPVVFTEAGSLNGVGSVLDVEVAGSYAYLADSFGGMQVVDVTEPSQPLQVSAFDSPGSTRGQGVFAAPPYLYLADGQGIRILDTSDPATPLEVGFYDTLGFALDLQVIDDLAYVAAREGGLSIGNLADPGEPQHLSQFFDAGSVHVLDVQISGSYAYVAMESLGLRVVDVSQPANPVEVGSLETGGMAEALELSGTHLYLADGEQGVRVIDVSDPTNPQEIGHIDTPGYAQDVTLAHGYLFAADGPSRSLLVLDINDPSDPQIVSQYEAGGFVWGVAVADSHAYLALGEGGLLILQIKLN